MIHHNNDCSLVAGYEHASLLYRARSINWRSVRSIVSPSYYPTSPSGINIAYRWKGFNRLSERYGSVGQCVKDMLCALVDGLGGLHHLLDVF